jgi:hypothetical protein
MKKHLSVLFTIVAILAIAGSAMAQAAAFKLRIFGTGTVTINGPNSAEIINDTGEFGGVYIQSISQTAKPLNQVVFEFRSTEAAAGGAPRFSIPIDTDGQGGAPEGYAFLDVFNCGGASAQETIVSTTSATCAVNFQFKDYANWEAFAAEHPTYRTAPGAIPFIIADQPGTYAVDSIVLR